MDTKRRTFADNGRGCGRGCASLRTTYWERGNCYTMESALLAPKSEVSLYPWKDTKEKIPLAVRQVRTFLRAHRPAMV